MDSVEKQPLEQPAQTKVTEKDQNVASNTVNERPGVKRESGPGADRLLALCDGIFAIATTLLVIDIRLPSNLTSENAFNNALYNLFTNYVLYYLITFIVVASFWMQHRRMMRHVKYQDDHFVRLTMLFLVFIAFFPVTSSIIGPYNYSGAIMLYTLTFSGCGFSLFLCWLYASWHHRLIEPGLAQDEITSFSIHTVITPVYFSLSLLLLLFPIKSTSVFWSWLLLPVFSLTFRLILRSKVISSLVRSVSSHAGKPHST